MIPTPAIAGRARELGRADRFRLRLVPELHAPRAARHAVAGLRAIPLEHADTVAVLLTELVANSVVHAALRTDQAIEMSVIRSAGVLRVEVLDQGRGFKAGPPPADPLAVGGRGLVLVESLSDRWGIDRERGTCVWFELDVAEPPAVPAPAGVGG